MVKEIHRLFFFALFSLIGIIAVAASHGLAVNAPTAVNDENYGPEGVEQSGDVSTNDFDLDDDDLIYSVVVEPEHGSITMNEDGTYTYQPDALYVGFDYVTYQVCDPSGLCDEAQIEFGMTFVNYTPVAENDFFYVFIDGILESTIAENDYEINDEPFWFNLLAEPEHAASFTFNSDGTFTYVPNEGYEGNDTFLYQICDPCGACDFAIVDLEMVPPNPAPTAQDDSNQVAEDNTLNASVDANDADPEGDLLSFEVTQMPANGTVSLEEDGSYTYIPAPDYFGPDSFYYQACDPFLQCDEAMVSINVIFINDNPVALDDYFELDEDGTISGTVADNDYDVDFEPIEWMMWQQPEHGELVWNEVDGSFEYTPDPDFNGEDQLRYFMLDPCGATGLAYAYFTVNSVNDAPEVNGEQEVMDEDGIFEGDLSSNDSDIDSGELIYSLISSDYSGSITINPDGSFSFIPELNYSGVQSFDYLVSDGDGAEVEATLSITVNEVNDEPLALADFVIGEEDSSVSGTVAANDSDVDSENLEYLFLSTPENGSLESSADGSFTFTPDANFFGTVIIDYEVCDEELCSSSTLEIDISSINDIPQAQNSSFQGQEDFTLTGSLVALASDVEDAELIFDILSLPGSGELSLLSDGSFEYSPALNEFGLWSFTYEVCDSEGACVEAEIELEITGINDAPVAENDNYELEEDSQFELDFTANDSDVDDEDFTVQIISSNNGQVNETIPGQFTFTPDEDFFGETSFEYSICDEDGACASAVVTLTVTAVNDAPVASDDSFGILMNQNLESSVATNDIDVDDINLFYSLLENAQNGDLNFNSDGSFEYEPNTDFSGSESVQYQVCDDDGECSIASLQIDVTNTNEAPLATDDSFSIDEDTVLDANIALNDSDPNEDNLTFTLISATEGAEIELSLNGQLSIVPQADFNGTITVEYEACDQFNECASATVTIDISPVNDGPIAQNDENATDEDITTSGTLSENDVDVDEGDVLIYSLISDGDGLTLNDDGTYSFVPEADFFGELSWDYEVCDQENECSTATLTIFVEAVNDAPEALDDEYVISSVDELMGNVGDNDDDVDSNDLFFTLLDPAEHGSIEMDSEGNFSYTPNDEFTGLEQLTYEICDNEGLCVEAELIITVIEPNFPPQFTGLSVNEICGAETLVLDLDEFLSDDQTAVEDLIIPFITASSGEVDLNNHVLQYSPDSESTEVNIEFTVCDTGENSTCAEFEISLNIIPAFEVDLQTSTIVDVSCFGGSDGSVNLLFGDNDFAPIVDWSTGTEGESIEDLTAGTYSVMISAETTCVQNIEMEFEVVEPDMIEIIGLEAVPIGDEPGGASDFEVSGGTVPYDFEWYDGQGNLVTEGEDLGDLDSAEQAGIYDLLVTDANGCTAEASLTITDIPNDIFKGLNIYPNPVNDVLYLEYSGSSSVLDIELTDSRGRLIQSIQEQGDFRNEISTTSLESGVYFVKIQSGETIKVVQIIKQ